MKQLLEEMIWCWIQDTIMPEFTGRSNTDATHEAILKEADKRCLIPLREAGIITVWKLSLTKQKNHMILVVDVEVPESKACPHCADLNETATRMSEELKRVVARP